MALPDLRKLRHVVGVANAGSFTSASRLLGITQSALTKSVADVEHQLGVALFERLPRGVAPTPAGARFIERAGRLLADAGDLMAELDDISQLKRGQLRIGVAPAAYIGFLSGSLGKFGRAYPGVEIRVSTGTTDEMARSLVNGELDLCLGATNYLAAWTELDISTISPLHYFFIGCANHPAVRGKKPDARTLLQYPLVLPSTDLSTALQLAEAYQAAGVSPAEPHYVCDDLSLIMEIVASTQAISPLVALQAPDDRLRSRYTVFEDVIKLRPLTLGIAVLRSRPAPPALATFETVLRKVLGFPM